MDDEIFQDQPDGGSEPLVDRLFGLLWWQLRAQAREQLARERKGHTLQPTDLVNELFLKLRRSGLPAPLTRERFLGLAAYTMRRLLVDHARRKRRVKRGPGLLVPDADLDRLAAAAEQDMTGLDALTRSLEASAPRAAQVLYYHVMAGYSFEEIADQLEISARTVYREWRFARAFVARELLLEDEAD